MISNLPAIGSRWRWHNRLSTRIYTVIDVFVDHNGSLEVRYRSDDMTADEYRQRSVESFYSKTRDGQPRFVPMGGDRHA